MKEKDKTPMLKGFIRHHAEGDLIEVWCPFCCKFHIHGWPVGSDTAKQHRGAHCIGDTPFNHTTGYYIKPFSQNEIEGGKKS